MCKRRSGFTVYHVESYTTFSACFSALRIYSVSRLRSDVEQPRILGLMCKPISEGGLMCKWRARFTVYHGMVGIIPSTSQYILKYCLIVPISLTRRQNTATGQKPSQPANWNTAAMFRIGRLGFGPLGGTVKIPQMAILFPYPRSF